MGRALALFACAAALVLPAAASADDPPFIDWTPLLPGFPTGYQPSKEKDCLDGSDQCIERTLAEMYRRFDRLYATCDHNSVFALTYIRVTEAIRKSVADGLYEEPQFLNHEDAVFARMYFMAYDAWERGDRDSVPDAWEAAFDAGRDRTVAGIGNLLMSMNAHVNRDMPFMLANLGLAMPNGSSRKPDHDRGNQVLNPLYDDVLDEIGRRWDPTISNYNVPGVAADDTGFFQILQGWREQVWRHAEMLVNAPTPEARQAVADYIEDYALEMGRRIESGSRMDPAARDAHCAAYQRENRERGALARAVIGRRGLRARGGAVRVRFRCPAGIRLCDGTVSLERLRRPPARKRAITAARSRQIGAARSRPPALLASKPLPVIEPGRSVVVRLGLARKTRRALRRTRRFRVRARVQSTTPWGFAVSSSRQGRLRRRR
jgi:Family of unknown function (DUF5995)